MTELNPIDRQDYIISLLRLRLAYALDQVSLQAARADNLSGELAAHIMERDRLLGDSALAEVIPFPNLKHSGDDAA